MAELLQHLPENPFQKLLAEQLADKEFEGKNIAVFGIGGLPGTGLTSTANELGNIIRAETDVPVHIFSFQEERRRIYHELTGHYESEGDTERELQAGLKTDLFMAGQMISPENSNSIVIIEGRLGPYIAKEMQFAGEDLEKQRRLKKPLPFSVLTVYLAAREDVRHTRKYLQAVNQEPLLDLDGYRNTLKEELQEEQKAFWRAYPDLFGRTLNSMNIHLRGKQLYDMRYDTTGHTAKDIAANILTDPRARELISIPQVNS